MNTFESEKNRYREIVLRAMEEIIVDRRRREEREENEEKEKNRGNGGDGWDKIPHTAVVLVAPPWDSHV